MQPLFSIVIVSLNGEPVIRMCLDSIRRSSYEHYEVIVVDNGSTDDLARIVREEYPEVRLIRSPVNLGFAGGNNLGLAQAHGDILVLLNDDIEVRPDWLDAWAAAARRYPRWGALGAKLLYPDGQTLQHAGGWLEPTGCTQHYGYGETDHGQHDTVRHCDYVTGAALAIRREAYERLGGLDEGYFPIYFEETDYCWQLRRVGYEVLYVPDCVLLHHESRTQGRFSGRFYRRYWRCRLRFALRCYSAAQLRFGLRYELYWWRSRHNIRCWPHMLYAYAHALLRLPAYYRDRKRFHQRMRALDHELRPGIEARPSILDIDGPTNHHAA